MGDLPEHDLRTTASRLAALIEHVQAGIFVEDESRRIVHVNAELCAKFGISVPPQDLVGTDGSQAAQQVKQQFAEPEEFVERVEALLRERQVVTAEDLSLVDGRIFERDYIPIFVYGEYRGHLWQYRDVTGRRRAQQARRESEEKYRTVVETVQEGIGIVDPEERITYCNEAYAAIFGLTPGELVGRSLFEFLDEPERRKVLGETALRKANVRSSYEIAITTRDGSRKCLCASGAPIFDGDVRFRGTCGSIVTSPSASGRRKLSGRARRCSAYSSSTLPTPLSSPILTIPPSSGGSWRPTRPRAE